MTDTSNPRRPRAFHPDDPAVKAALKSLPPDDDADWETSSGRSPAGSPIIHKPKWQGAEGGLRWGLLLITALIGLVVLSATTWLTSSFTAALARQDWIGWTALALLGIAGLAALVIALREFIGLMRLRRLHRFRQEVEAALTARDQSRERKCVSRLKSLYRGRPDMIWALRRMRDHEGDIRDAGEMLTLAERDLIVPLDQQARIAITSAAKKVSVATAISPAAVLDMLFVLATNLSLLRQLAGLYGARPGMLGSLKLAKMVVGHIIATGGIALTDDLFGQFLGQDLVRRLSRRLGEGVFNGALTARIGVAAIDVLRPLPFIEAKPVRLRELVPIIFRKAPGEEADSPPKSP